MSKKRSFLALVLAVVMCFSLLLTGCGKEKQPEKAPADQLSYSMDKTATAIAGRLPDLGAIGDSLNKGKISIDALGMLDGEMYIDSAAGFLAEYLHFGPEEGGFDLSLFLKDQALAVNFPMVFGDKAYGVDLSTLEEDLKDSAIWELMGTTYEEAMKDVDLGALTAGATDTLDMAGELQKELQAAVDKIQISSKLDKVQLDGEETEAIVVSFQLTSGDVAQMADIYMDWMEKYMESSVAGLVGEAKDQLADFRTQLEDSFDQMDLTLDVAVNIDPETEYVMSIDGRVKGTVDGEPGDIMMSLVLGKEPAAAEKYVLTVSSMDGSQTMASVEAVLKLQDSDDQTSATLTVSSDENGVERQVFDGSFKYEKQSQKFYLDVDSDGTTFSMEGMLRYKEDVFQLYIASVKADGEETVLDFNLSCEAMTGGELPEMPSYTDLTELTKEQWQGLILSLGYLFGQFGI